MKNVSAEACAEMLEEEPGLVSEIYELIRSHADWDDTRIFHEIKKD